MKKIFFLFLVVSITATAQSNTQQVAARYPGLAAYSRENVDLYATRNNVAALAQLKNNAFGVYAENRFLIPELNLYAASIGLKVQHGAFALHGSYFGLDVYHQLSLSLGYGMSVTKNVDVGVQFNYQSLQQAGGFYGSASSINASVGAIFHLTDKVHAGIGIYNPTGSQFGKNSGEKLPAQFTFGMGYDASDKVYVSAEMVKEENLPAGVNAGFQYQFQKQFFMRLGVSTASSNVYAGFGLAFQHYRIDIAASYHPQLGISPGVLLLFDIGKVATDSQILH